MVQRNSVQRKMSWIWWTVAFRVATAVISCSKLGLPGNAHEATALIRVRRDTAHILDDDATQPSAEQYHWFKNNQAKLLTSTHVLNAALRKPGIAQLDLLRDEDDPASWILCHLQIEVEDDSEVISVSMTGSDSNEITRIVDAIVESYLQEIVQSEREDDLAGLEILKRTSRQLLQDLKEKKELIHNLSREVGSPDDPNVTITLEFTNRKLDRIERKMDRLELKLEEIELELALLVDNKDGEGVDVNADVDDSLVRNLKRKEKILVQQLLLSACFV